jgi:hypothetical protein
MPETWNVLLNPQQEDAPIEGGLAQILSLGPQALRIVVGAAFWQEQGAVHPKAARTI